MSALLFISSCDQQTSFVGANTQKRQNASVTTENINDGDLTKRDDGPPNDGNDPTGGPDNLNPSDAKPDTTPTAGGETTSVPTLALQQGNRYSENFQLNMNTQPFDFLFVVDNSSSMKSYATNMAAGLLGLSVNAFPTNSRLGIMTTMIGDPSDLSKTHPEISTYKGINYEPGFLALVDAPAVQAFKTTADNPQRKAYDAFGVCDQGWFLHGDVSSKGNRCFQGALQSPHYGVGCEAGLLAFSQIMTKYKNKNTSLFRQGAQAVVTFISDEQNGCTSAVTTTNLPTADKLRQQVLADGASSLVLNGVVGLDQRTHPYPKPVADSGGVLLDIKSPADQYVKILQKIVDTAKPEPTFKLAKPADKVAEVRINDKPTTDFVLVDPTTVKLKQSVAANDKIEIIYFSGL